MKFILHQLVGGMITDKRIVTPRWMYMVLTLVGIPVATYLFTLAFPTVPLPVLDGESITLIGVVIYMALTALAGYLAPTDPRLQDALEELDNIMKPSQHKTPE